MIKIINYFTFFDFFLFKSHIFFVFCTAKGYSPNLMLKQSSYEKKKNYISLQQEMFWGHSFWL